MIDSYEFGRIVVDGQEYTSDIVIYPEKVDSNWWRKEGHSLCLEDIKSILDYKPDVLIIGRGASSIMSVPANIVHHLKEKGIKAIARDTHQAVEEYNHLCGKKKVVGAFHLTC